MIATGTTSFTDMYYFCDRIAEAALACGIKANIGRGISCFDPAKSFRDLPAYGEIRELLSSMQGAGGGPYPHRCGPPFRIYHPSRYPV